MIRTTALPKHCAPTPSTAFRDGTTLVWDEVEVRDYPDSVCTGMHCIGRLRVVEHRLTNYPMHYLSPEQILRAGGSR